MSRLSLVSLALALAGAAIAAYLTYVHYNIDALVCAGGGCEVVQTSKYSEIMGIPVAIFGLAMFLGVAALIVIRDRMLDYADLANAGIIVALVAALIYYAYLTYLEARVIYAWCEWCIITSIITLVLFLIEANRLRREFADDSYEAA